MTIRVKITLLFTLLVTVLLVLISFSVYYFSARHRANNFRQRLYGRSHNVAQLYQLLGDSSVSLLTKIDRSNAQFYASKSVHIYSTTGKPFYIFNTLPSDDFHITAEELESIRQHKEWLFQIGDRDAFGQFVEDDNPPFIVVVAANDVDGKIWLSDLRKILSVACLAGCGLSMLAGIIFSRQLIKPISAIIEEVNNISTHNLSQRIKAGSGQDELSRLSETFNDLLNRMQESFATQRRFISNASHELSTPLTSISSQLEVTLQKQRTDEEYRDVLLSVQEDVQQMRQLTKSLLDIAKTGHKGSIALDELRLDELLLKITAAVTKLSPEYQVQLHVDELPDDEKASLVFGNADLLYSALKNVIENGCKYSPDHTSRVFLRFSAAQLIVDVKNNGNPIDRKDVEHIFQPFYRSAKTLDKKGFGLGLALASRIISIHKGTINHDSGNRETVFRITLPSVGKFSS
ncbi:HAMP domain-containing sensor histidine kinase [Flavihumibacter petaseus]|uniref:histidine kinase n=1 Tax=Flavihumibacter petaseus NBRC 106054 TaxID=1220578 RepID=A0A0E9MXD8_9BACT|nr:HAMP domain-containing sensor histidine kinase [Flavihumibacter petaseus]GAO42279.1 putative two-component histidine kinase [Flavihumibacter petaseus NBRC 106054]